MSLPLIDTIHGHSDSRMSHLDGKTDLGDPTKLKARQFSRGGSTATRGAPNNLWTETPAERQQRVADEVAGKKRRAANAEEDPITAADERKKRKHEEDIRKAVDAHNVSLSSLFVDKCLTQLFYRNPHVGTLYSTCTPQKRSQRKRIKTRNRLLFGIILAIWLSEGD